MISGIILAAASRLMTKPTTPLQIHHHTYGYVRGVKYQISQAHGLVVLSKLYQTPSSRSSICLMICCVNHCNQPLQSDCANLRKPRSTTTPKHTSTSRKRSQYLQKLKVLNLNCDSIRSQHKSVSLKQRSRM